MFLFNQNKITIIQVILSDYIKKRKIFVITHLPPKKFLIDEKVLTFTDNFQIWSNMETGQILCVSGTGWVGVKPSPSLIPPPPPLFWWSCFMWSSDKLHVSFALFQCDWCQKNAQHGLYLLLAVGLLWIHIIKEHLSRGILRMKWTRPSEHYPGTLYHHRVAKLYKVWKRKSILSCRLWRVPSGWLWWY